MAVRQPRYPPEEFVRRGRELYDNQIRSQVEEGNDGRILSIDIESGEYEIGDTTMEANSRLLERIPDAQIFCLRIGHPAVYRVGFGPRRVRQ